MMNDVRRGLILAFVLIAVFLIGEAGQAVEEGDEPETTAEPAEASNDAPSVPETIVYVPYDFGAPDVTEAGGVRGSTKAVIQLLAPEQLARTLSDTPTFYWYADQAIGRHRFTLVDDRSIDPLLEVTLDPVSDAGIYHLNLANHDVTLDQSGLYRWSIAASLDTDPIAAETVAETVFAYEDRADDVPSDASPAILAGYLSANGYWYDLLDLVSREIDREDGERWRSLRTRLLRQVDLTLPPG